MIDRPTEADNPGMQWAEIADRTRYATCLRCDRELPVRVWSELERGLLAGTCEDCGCAMLMDLCLPEEPEPVAPERLGLEPEPDPWKLEQDARRAAQARSHLRLLEDIPPPEPPPMQDAPPMPTEDGPPAPVRDPPPPPAKSRLEELTERSLTAPTARQRLAAEVALRRLKREQAGKRQRKLF